MKKTLLVLTLILVVGILSQCTSNLLTWEKALNAGKELLKTGDFARALTYFQTAYEKGTDNYEKGVAVAFSGWANIGLDNLAEAKALCLQSILLSSNEFGYSGLIRVLYLLGEHALVQQRISEINTIPGNFSIFISEHEITKTQIVHLAFLSLGANGSVNDFNNLKITQAGFFEPELVEEMEGFFF